MGLFVEGQNFCLPPAKWHEKRRQALRLAAIFRYWKTDLADLLDREALEKELSGELSVTSDTPPMFLWHTAGDTGVDVENSLNMASALSAAKRPFELHIFPDGDHGLGLAEDVPGTREWGPLAADWLLRMGY